MNSYPTWEQVRGDVGDKVIDGLVVAVERTRADLADYRNLRPTWVAQSSERGLASWIHDRLWVHLIAEIDGLPNVSVKDKEPHREIGFGYTYRMRVKRHHEDGSVETYRTPLALEFLAQAAVQGTFDGMEDWHLIAGYYWNRELREIGDAVFSLRDGDRIIWEQRPQPPSAGEEGGTPLPALPEPPAPIVDDTAASKDRERADEGE